MGVSNVNNLNKIDLTKLGLLGKTRSTQSNKPAYMQMTGSIFNAPQVKNNSSTTSNLSTLNTTRSLNELKTTNTKTTSSNEKTESKKENEEGNVDQGSVKDLGNQAKKGTSEAKKYTAEEKQVSSEAKTLNKNIKKEDKKFQAQLKQQQADLKKDNTKIEKLAQETDEAQLQIDNAQNELDGLLASSTFSINGFNGTQGGQSTSGSSNQDRINELQKLIGSKTTLVQSNGKQIYSLRRSSSRTLSRMNRTNANYIKTHKHNAKAIKQNQNETSGVIKTATTIEQYSALAEQGGKALDMLGQGLVLAGQELASSLSPVTAAIGSAMIATGTVMSKIGTVAEMLGQYGQAAANITKTAAYAAEGNLMGAMTSAAAAMQSGAAAAKSTKNLKDTFGEIDQRAQEATKKAAANATAKETIKNAQDDAVKGLGDGATKEQIKQAKADALGGMSKKDAKKALSQELQSSSFGENDANVTGKWSKKQFKQYKEQMTAGTANGGTVATDGLATVKDKYQENVKAQLKKTGLDSKYAVGDNGKIVDVNTRDEVSIDTLKAQGLKGDAKQIKAALKKGNQATKTSFANKAAKAMKSSKNFDFQGMAQGIVTTVALFGAQNNSTTTHKNHNGGYRTAGLESDPRYLKIRNSHRVRQYRSSALA